MEQRCVLVCVTSQRSCERLIAVGARYARQMQAELMVLHVAGKGNWVMDGLQEAEALEFLFSKATEYGGDMTVVRADYVAEAIENQARKTNAAMIVAGRAADYDGWDLLDDLKTRLKDVGFTICPAARD